MVNGIRASDPHAVNKERGSKYAPKSDKKKKHLKKARGHIGWNINITIKDEDNRLKTQNDKNYQASSQKLRQFFCSKVRRCILYTRIR